MTKVFPLALILILSSVCVCDVLGEAPSSIVLPEGVADAKMVIFRVECQMIVLPSKLALPLIPELADDEKSLAAVARLQKLMASGDAAVVANLLARGPAQEKISAQSVEEVRYETQWNPPRLPEETLSGPDALEVLRNWPAVSITPTEFGVRNVGPMIEITLASTSDPEIALCTYHTQHVRLDRMVKNDAGRVASGERLFIEQPSFSTLEDRGQVFLKSGNPTLIGIHRLPSAPDSTELFLLTMHAK